MPTWPFLLLTRHALERLLHRLSLSPHHEQVLPELVFDEVEVVVMFRRGGCWSQLPE